MLAVGRSIDWRHDILLLVRLLMLWWSTMRQAVGRVAMLVVLHVMRLLGWMRVRSVWMRRRGGGALMRRVVRVGTMDGLCGCGMA